MLRFLRILVFICLSLVFSLLSFSQSTACKREIAVSVFGPTFDSFRGLNAEDFLGRIGKGTVPVVALTFDDGPRRVLLVVDTGKKNIANTGRAEIEILNTMLAVSRPGDSFALITTSGQERTVKFGEDRAKLSEVLKNNIDGKRPQDVGVLDAVAEGIEWFGARQSGDAIVVLAVGLEGNHKANPKTVAKLLDGHGIRLFGLAMGPVATRNITAGGSMTSTTSQGLAWTTPGIGDIVYNTGDQEFYPLTLNSGGLVLGVIDASSRAASNLDDPNVKQRVETRARQVSKLISVFYRLEITPPQRTRSEDWTLDVTEPIHKIAPKMWVLYPHDIGPC